MATKNVTEDLYDHHSGGRAIRIESVRLVGKSFTQRSHLRGG